MVIYDAVPALIAAFSYIAVHGKFGIAVIVHGKAVKILFGLYLPAVVAGGAVTTDLTKVVVLHVKHPERALV